MYNSYRGNVYGRSYMISRRVEENLGKSSWIRKMFEEGAKLKAIHGEDKVYDFSIGNPYFEPPTAVVENLKNIVNDDIKGLHRYMANAGFQEVREKVAAAVSEGTKYDIPFNNVVMTVGAAGALNVCLKTLLNPGEEVIMFAPYFVEYIFYIQNHGGESVIAQTDHSTFEPDLDSFRDSITSKTKAVIINSPNNPTGVIYSAETLEKMAAIIKEKEQQFGTSIFVLSDEPYAVIRYDNVEMPHVFDYFENVIIANSFSKSLGLAGERIGYLAVSSRSKNLELLMNGIIFANRTLGFVNAPAIFQKVIGDSVNDTVDVNLYLERRDLLYNHLVSLGFTCVKPQGAFYLFPKAPIEDDIEFVMKAKEFNLLLVPGTGFGCPGYFRLSYCIGVDTIENSKEAWTKLAEYYGMK